MNPQEFIFLFNEVNNFELNNLFQNDILNLDYLVCRIYEQIIIDDDKNDRNPDPNHNHFNLFENQLNNCSYYFVGEIDNHKLYMSNADSQLSLMILTNCIIYLITAKIQ